MTPSPTISDKAINVSMRRSIVAGSIGTFFFMVMLNGTVLPLLFERLGAGGVAIGMTSAMWQFGMLVQIPSSFYAERLARRRPFWVWTSAVARAAIVIPGLHLLVAPDDPTTSIWLMLAALTVFCFVAQTSGPTWFSWTADLVPEKRRAHFWAVRQGVAMIVSVVSVVAIGWFLDLFPETSAAGFGWILIFASFMGLMDVVVNSFVLEPPPSPANRALPVRERVLRPLRDRDFRFFTWAMCAWTFSLGLLTPFQFVYLKETFAVSYKHVYAIQMCGTISGVISCFMGGKLINRVGLRSFGLTILSAIPLFSSAWFFLHGSAVVELPWLGAIPQPVLLLCAGALIAGGLFAAVLMLQLNLLSALSPKEGKTMAMAVHWTVVGAVSALGPVVGGVLKDWISAHPTGIALCGGTELSYFHIILILHAVLVWGLTISLLRRVKKQEGEWPWKASALHIFVVTPLRAARNLYPFTRRAN